MVQKAKLDVLENLPDIDITDIMIQAADTPELPRTFYRGKWALNKLVLIAAPAVLVILMIGGVLWFYFTPTKKAENRLQSPGNVAVIEKKESQHAREISAQTAIEPVKTSSAYYKDFIIDLKDKTGKDKILMCDVALDVSEAGNIAKLENSEDIRNIIYQTTAGRNAVVLRSIDERNNLKKELLREVNRMLGEGVVKNVYFTNYVIM